jgi:hypothetical protein
MKATTKQKPSVRWLRLKYRLIAALIAPLSDAWWFLHQIALRLRDQLESLNGRGNR